MKRDKADSIDQYIAGFPNETQIVLEQVRDTIRKKLPKAEETISYAIPSFKLNKAYVVYFAGYKNHIGLYPIPKGDEVFENEIAPFKKGKGTLQFPLTQPMPLDLITKVVEFRIKEIAERGKSK